jgi:uncharacterized protein with von Willebrand factor type A (vWA) domain
MDQSGVAITSFALGNFVVSENGTPGVVMNYQKVNNTINALYTVICIDESGSMGSDLAVAQTAAISYVNAMAANDYAEISFFRML